MSQNNRLPRRSAPERAAEVRQVVHARGRSRHRAGTGPELSLEGRCRLQALRPPTAWRGLRRKAASAEAWPGPAAGAGTAARRAARGRDALQGLECGHPPWLNTEPPFTAGGRKPEDGQIMQSRKFAGAHVGAHASDHLPVEQRLLWCKAVCTTCPQHRFVTAL